jgi:hypothetical protein
MPANNTPHLGGTCFMNCLEYAGHITLQLDQIILQLNWPPSHTTIQPYNHTPHTWDCPCLNVLITMEKWACIDYKSNRPLTVVMWTFDHWLRHVLCVGVCALSSPGLWCIWAVVNTSWWYVGEVAPWLYGSSYYVFVAIINLWSRMLFFWIFTSINCFWMHA